MPKTTTTQPGGGAARRRDLSGLATLAGVGIGGLALSVIYARTGLGISCPFLALTGWWCPLCGGTRMGASLLTGHVATAFWFNPLAFVGLIAAVGLGLLWLGQLAMGRTPALPRRLRWLTGRTGLIALGVVLVAFTVLRNLT